jgi:hypothetical protein
VRSPKEDVAIISAAGLWDQRDPLLTSVILLLIYGKNRHKPLLNLRRLADAVEGGDESKIRKRYDGLVKEVGLTLRKYPDIVDTVNTMSEMSDEDLARIDELMR